MARNVNRRQKAQYAGGSRAKGWYEYTVQGVQVTNLGGASRTERFEFVGRGATRDEAITNAWKEAKHWETEIGEQIIEGNAL
jgi:hypothetical protein